VSVICIVVGYWLVSTLIKPGPTVRGGGDANRTPPPKNERPKSDSRSTPDRPAAPANETWYQVLGVSRNATHAEVAAAYRSRISEYHPDKVAKMGTEIRAVAERKSKQINVAYNEALKHVRE
jgi:DnaJ like chaperone protein